MLDPAEEQSRAVFEAWHLELVGSEPVARLGTIGADGTPHLVPVCFALVERRIVIAIDEKPKRGGRLARIANIERDARVTLLVDHYEDDWAQLAWVRIDGEAEVMAAGSEWPEALEALRARYSQYREMALESLPLIVIRPRRAAGWRWSGD